MAKELDNDPRIPTLTDVVKQGNPSLMFNLKPPRVQPADHDQDTPAAEVATELGEQEAADSMIELDVYEKEVQADMFRVNGHPDESDLVISQVHVEQTTQLAEGSAVITEPQEPESEHVEDMPQKAGFSLEALGLPFDFFSKATRDDEAMDEPVADQAEATDPDHDATQPVSTPPETTSEEINHSMPNLDVESVLMALEVPISEILQRHMESARDEIHTLIREQLERQNQD